MPPRTKAAQGLLKRLLGAKRLDRDIDAPTTQPVDLGNNINSPIVKGDIRAHTTCDVQPLLIAINADYQRCAH